MPKISALALSDSSEATDSDYIVAVIGGVTKRMTLTELREEMQGGFSVLFYGAVADADQYGVGTDNTGAIQAACDAAYSSGFSSVYVPDGKYCVNGTVTLPQGVTLYGTGLTGQYEDGFPMTFGASLIKPSSGDAGPIISMGWASSVHHLFLKHLKSGGATTGILRVGGTAGDTNITYDSITDIHILGLRTGDIDGTTTCYGIYFPDSDLTPTAYARFFNQVSNYWITECDVAVRLGCQSNGNNFTGGMTRECHVHYELNGGAGTCIENNFTGFGCYTIGTITPAAIVFRLRNQAKRNTFMGYNTEAQGKAFQNDANCIANIFAGLSNEITPSVVGPANVDLVERPWTTPTYSAGDFTASGSMVWTVDAGDVMTYQYMIVGHAMFLKVALVTTAITGSISDHVNIKIPGGFLGGKLSAGLCHLNIGGTAEVGYWQVNVSSNLIEVYRFTFANHVVAALNVVGDFMIDVSG